MKQNEALGSGRMVSRRLTGGKLGGGEAGATGTGGEEHLGRGWSEVRLSEEQQGGQGDGTRTGKMKNKRQ